MHVPVLLKETIEILDPKPGEFFIDGTLGGGGHGRAILEKVGAQGTLLAVDLDAALVRAFEKKANVIALRGNYAHLKRILRERGLPRADGIVIDLGFSSNQLVAGRGFSFRPSSAEEPLDMRYDAEEETYTAADAIRALSERELVELFFRYGEERAARRIAKEIVLRRKTRPLLTVGDLVAVVESASPRRGKIHPATKVFQALRIYVNRELENLAELLRDVPAVINAGGRAAIISFHSLEDRLVKRAFRDYAQTKQAILLTKKPIVPSQEEIKGNPRARSAKLRAIRII